MVWVITRQLCRKPLLWAGRFQRISQEGTGNAESRRAYLVIFRSARELILNKICQQCSGYYTLLPDGSCETIIATLPADNFTE